MSEIPVTDARSIFSGIVTLYSKNPDPVPFTFRPSSTFHCFELHSAEVKEEGLKVTSLVLSIFPVLSPSTRKLTKLWCRTFPEASSSVSRRTARHGSEG